MRLKLDQIPPKPEYIVSVHGANGSCKTFFLWDFMSKKFPPETYPLFALSKATCKMFDSIEHTGEMQDNTAESYVHEFYNRGLKKVSSQFMKKIAEVHKLLDNMYDMVPQPNSFLAWYTKKKLWSYIKRHTKMVWVRKTLPANEFETPFVEIKCLAVCSYPEISNSDLQEYCIYIHKELKNNDRKLRSAKRPTVLPAKRKPFIGSLGWIGDSKLVDDLYEYMNGVYVNCTLEEFRGILGVDDFKGPVKWITDIVSEMLYFIHELEDKGFREKRKKQNWKVIKRMFVKSTGEEFDEHLRNIYTGIEGKISHKTAENISNILDSLKPGTFGNP